VGIRKPKGGQVPASNGLAESNCLIALDQALLSGGADSTCSSLAKRPSGPKPKLKRLNQAPVFIGEYQHSIDEKGRLAVPVKFRTRLAKGAVVTRGLDQSLFLYPMEEWKQLAERLARLPIAQSNTRAFARLMLAGAMDVETDKQGRIVVPEYLRKYAKITKQVVLAGLYNRIELWDKAIWQRYTAATEKNSGDIAEQLTDLGV